MQTLNIHIANICIISNLNEIFQESSFLSYTGKGTEEKMTIYHILTTKIISDSFGTMYTRRCTGILVDLFLIIGAVISEGLGTSQFLGSQTCGLGYGVSTDDQVQTVAGLGD